MPQKTKNTPMMEQYLDIKSQYQDAFLFYRLGDFYEMFYEDAEKASQILELTLTARNKNAIEPIPMCGIPYHAAQNYIDTLIEQGYKVAICEQVEDPKTTKGMVRREVVQLITPGTVMESKGLNAKENNYLIALSQDDSEFGLAYSDLTTGEIKATRLLDIAAVVDECASLQAKELVVSSLITDELANELNQRLDILFSFQDELEKKTEFNSLLTSLDNELEYLAAQRLISYLIRTQKRSLGHLQQATSYEVTHYLKFDQASKINLEVTQALRTGKKQGTLLWLLDETKTAMGGRLLKQWLDRPLIQHQVIINRQKCVESLYKAYFERIELQEKLKQVYDLERLAGRVAFGSVNGRDLIQLKTSLRQIPLIRELIKGLNHGEWTNILEKLNPLTFLADLIEKAIKEDAPLSVTEGGIINDSFNEQLDSYRDAMQNGKKWLAELEAREREATGIKNLKVGFNRVFGYYIEITKSGLANLEEGKYERKQTLANAERFITDELKSMEVKILEAEEQSKALEYELFKQVREEVIDAIQSLQELAYQVAQLDVYQSFATVSENYQYTCPILETNGQDLEIIDGRHPVVEKVLGHQAYIPNDILLDEKTDILLITGPNMSGKSTYMRQLALTVIMAQIGCFVPAKTAKLPIFDQIFTRIGASDDLNAGQSTFMVEMMEANNALQRATRQSLILFDELGRGTATYDGMALAQAIIEYIEQYVKAKTLFSTHYHELTSLADELPKVINRHVGAVEQEGELVFLHKMLEGPADKSYGIHVAQLAGLPDKLIERANYILAEFEGQEGLKQSPETNSKIINDEVVEINEQMSLFGGLSQVEEEILNKLTNLNIAKMTPIDALNIIYEMQKQLEDR